MPETDPAQLLPVLLDKMIDLGDWARQISHALGGNGHRPGKLQEIVQQLVTKEESRLIMHQPGDELPAIKAVAGPTPNRAMGEGNDRI